MIAYGHEIDIFVHCAGIQHRSPAEDFADTEWDNILSVNLTAGFQISRDLSKNWLNTTLKEYSGQPGIRKKILFVASVMSFMGGVEIPAYTASKGAIAQLTKALNNEWMAKGINVNASEYIAKYLLVAWSWEVALKLLTKIDNHEQEPRLDFTDLIYLVAPGYIETELTSGLRDHGEKEKTILQRTPIGRWGEPRDLAGPVIHLCSRSGDYVGGEVHVVDGGFLGR